MSNETTPQRELAEGDCRAAEALASHEQWRSFKTDAKQHGLFNDFATILCEAERRTMEPIRQQKEKP
jgi:hypothetical protein